MKELDYKNLILSAIAARKNAYAPYSGFSVGAALLCNDGKIYTGCNVENASYPVGACAERTAVLKAVSDGERSFCAIAIVGGDKNEQDSFSEYCMPCGLCRQLLSEFCNGDFKIISAKSCEDYKIFALKELLPFGFCL